MSQKPNSDNLSADPIPGGDDVSSEYQKMAGKETRESADISNQSDLLKNAAKADGINDANKSIDQNIEGASLGYSHPANTNPDALVPWVLKESYEQTNEDLKEYAEKVKPGNETELSRRKIPGVRVAILITGIIGLAIAAVFALRNPDSSAEVSQGLNQPDANSSVLVIVPTPATGCSIRFTSPANAAELPNFGPVLFEWNDVPIAAAYSLKVAPPADASLPWIYSVSENSKNVYLENFPMGGTFLVSVNALSSDEKVLCTATLIFNKKELAVGDNPGNNNKGSNDGEVAPASTPCVNTGIAYFCP